LWRHLANDNDTSTTTSFELVIIFLHHFSQPLCIVISHLLINDVRMTTFTHQLIARKKINARSLTMRVQTSSRSATVSVAVLRMGYAEIVFIQPGGKLDTM